MNTETKKITEYEFGKCVSKAIALITAITFGRFPYTQLINLIGYENVPEKLSDEELTRLDELVYIPNPGWYPWNCRISRIEADEVEEGGMESEEESREIRFFFMPTGSDSDDRSRKERHLATLTLSRVYCNGEDCEGWSRWEFGTLTYRPYEKEAWTEVGMYYADGWSNDPTALDYLELKGGKDGGAEIRRFASSGA